MITDNLKILMLEDSNADAEMIQRLLKKNGYNCGFKVMMTKERYEQALDEFKPDLILSDNDMPQFNASEALEILQQHSLHIPFILVTGTVSEEFAASIIKAGADDYLLKDRLTRLPAAIETALKQKQTEREKLEAAEELKQSEEKYRSMTERVTDGFVALDKNWKYTYVNKQAGVILRRKPEELIGKNIWEEFPEGIEKPFYKGYHKALEEQRYIHFEEYYPPFDFWLENHIYPSPDGVSIYFRDITERKKSEELLKDEREKFAKIAATAPGLIYSFKLTTDGIFSFPYASTSIGDILGFKLEEIEKDAAKVFSRGSAEEIAAVIQSIMQSAQTLLPWIYEFQYNHPIKGKIWLHGHSIPSQEPDGSVIWHGIISDITQRKDAEQKIIKGSRLYSFISQMNQMIVRTTDNATLFEEVCRIAVDQGKFRMAWIGMIDEQTRTVVPIIHAGKEEGYFSNIKEVSIDDVPGGWGPTGRALREGKYIICNDIENDPGMVLWKEQALSRGYKSSMSLPVKKFGKIIGSFSVYAPEKDFFDAEEITLLDEAVSDVSFALENFEREVGRKKAEEAVAKSEQRYHTLTEVSPVGVFHTDSGGYTTYVNPGWCKIAGLSFDEALGNGWLKAVHEKDKEDLIKGWKNATEVQELSTSEYRFVRPDGTIAWVFGQAAPERNTANEVVGYVGTITDITERKKAEEEIKTVNHRYETIARATNDGLWDWNLETNQLWGNEVHQQLYGLTLADQVPNHEEWQKRIHPEDRQRTVEALEEAKASGMQSYTDEYRFYTNNKGWMNIYGRTLIERNKEGKAVRLVGSMMDITERKKNEELLAANEKRFRKLVENGNDAFAILNHDGSVKYISSSVQRVLGYTEEEIYQMDMFTLVHPENILEVQKTMQEVLENPGVPVTSHISRLKHKDGSWRWFEDTITNLLDDPDIEGIVDNFRDITERVNNQMALAQSEEKHRDIVENITDILCTHDLDGNVLTVNATAKKCLGYEIDEMLKMNIRDIQLPYSKERFGDYIAALKKNGFAQGLMYVQTNTGEKKIWEFRNTLRTIEGKPSFVYGFAQDVTERIKAEETLKNKNAQLQTLSDNLPGVMIFQLMGELSGKRKFTYVSNGVQAISGSTPEEIIEDPSILYSLIIEEDIPQLIAAEKESFINMEVFNIEVRCRNYKGEVRWLNIISTPRKLDGGQVVWDGFHLDITERKKEEDVLRESEETFSKIFYLNPSVCAINDLQDDKFVNVNEAFINYFGFSKEEVIGKTSVELGIMIPDIRNDILNKMDEHGIIHNVEASVQTRSGEAKDVLLSTSNIYLHKKEYAYTVSNDITERKKAGEAIKKANERFELFAKATNDVIWDWNLVTGEVWWNQNYYNLFNFKDDGGVSKDISSWSEYIHAEDKNRILDGINKAIESGEKYWDDEYRFVKDDKSPMFIYDRGFVLHDEKGKAYRMIGSMLDFTERKKAEDEKKASDEQYRTLVEQASDGIFIADEAGKFIIVNTSGCKLSGYTAEELKELTIYNLVQPANLVANPFKFEEMHQPHGARSERKMLCKDGTELDVEISAKFLSDNRFIAFVRDISERKKSEEALKISEEKYRSLVEQASDAIFIADSEGRFITVNSSACKLSQYSEEELMKMTIYDFVVEEDIKKQAFRFEELKQGKTTLTERVMKDKNGDHIHVEITSKLLSDGRLLSFVRDISERVKAQEEIKQTSEKLRQLTAHLQRVREDERKRIGREIHDELGQQLTAIKMDVAWIDKKTSDDIPVIKNKLKNIITLLDGSNQSIRRILSELRPGILDDNGLLEALEWLNRQFTVQTGIAVEFDTTETELKLSEPVATCIYRIYQEAFTNITRYAKAGKVNTSLNIVNGEIIVTIEDDGNGFDPVAVQNKKSFGILGMKERILSLNGNFQLNSRPGKGTKITIIVPLTV